MTAEQMDGIFALGLIIAGAAIIWICSSAVVNVHSALGWQSRRLWCIPLTIGLILLPPVLLCWLVCVIITHYQRKWEKQRQQSESAQQQPTSNGTA